jgi:translation initiation factor IF-1
MLYILLLIACSEAKDEVNSEVKTEVKTEANTEANTEVNTEVKMGAKSLARIRNHARKNKTKIKNKTKTKDYINSTSVELYTERTTSENNNKYFSDKIMDRCKLSAARDYSYLQIRQKVIIFA